MHKELCPAYQPDRKGKKISSIFILQVVPNFADTDLGAGENRHARVSIKKGSIKGQQSIPIKYYGQDKLLCHHKTW